MGIYGMMALLTVIGSLLIAISEASQSSQPNIIFLLADDMGYNDISFLGSKQIPTPNIDALAASGCFLTNYYTAPVCTPSRSQIMTGKYAHHLGMQAQQTILSGEPWGLSLDEKLWPQYMNDLGYESYLYGKWHLGHYQKEYTPTFRGFKEHLGYWTGKIDPFDHTSLETNEGGNISCGSDFRRNLDLAKDLNGQYDSDVFTNAAVHKIETHHYRNPLFMMLNYRAPHSGNPWNPLRSPRLDKKGCYDDTSNPSEERSQYCGMVRNLDRNIGYVIEAAKRKGILDNTIIIFSSDNGGATRLSDLNAASNWPLRGCKHTNWEGGVHTLGLIWSPLFANKGRVCTQLIDSTDWLPTIYSAAGGNLTNLGNIDGKDQWSNLVNNQPSERNKVTHLISGAFGGLMKDNYKIIKGFNFANAPYNAWFGPSGANSSRVYGARQIRQSSVFKALSKGRNDISNLQIEDLRNAAKIKCPPKGEERAAKVEDCYPELEPCLFDIKEDPCENVNLARKPEYKDVLDDMLAELDNEIKSAAPTRYRLTVPTGLPEANDCTWTNFDDYSHPNQRIPQYCVLLETNSV